jgi:hypothetical protein
MNQKETLSKNVTEEEIQKVMNAILDGGHIEYISDRFLQVSRDEIITQTFIDVIQKNTEYKFDGVTISDGKLIAYFSKRSTCY